MRIVDARSYARKTTTNHIRAVYTPLDVNHVSEIIAKQSSFAYNALGVVRVRVPAIDSLFSVTWGRGGGYVRTKNPIYLYSYIVGQKFSPLRGDFKPSELTYYLQNPDSW